MGVVPLRSRLPSVVTIHDATFFSHPELHQPAKVRWFRTLLPRAAAAARLVLTDSLVSQAELARFGVASPDRIRVIPLAVDRRFRPPAPGAVASLRRDLGLTEPYVLFAGVLEPRKNLPRLIAAVLELRRRGFPHRLVLAGKPGWDRAPTEAAIATAGSAVVRLGFVPDETLRTLLGGSDAFAYVPLAEGFGLPVAEALACGSVV